MGLCKSFFCGNVCRDIEVKYTDKSNTAVATFDLAVNTGYGDRKKVNYFHLKAFSRTAEALGKYVSKGTKIIVECQPQMESWESKDGKKINREVHYVLSWEFAESKNTQQTQAEQQPSQPVSQPQSQPQANQKPWDSIPGYGSDLPFV